MPAGTGVWVVKMFALVAASRASAKVRCSSWTSRRIRSSETKAAWPSLMWRIVGQKPGLLERPQAADAEHDLLLEAHLVAPAVEAGGDLAVRRLVLRKVRVEEEEGHAPDLGETDEQVDRPAREGDRDDRGAPVRRLDDRERQVVGLEDRVGLGLAALSVDDLAEVALPIEEPDARRGVRPRSLADFSRSPASTPRPPA